VKVLKAIWRWLTAPFRALGRVISKPVSKVRTFLLDEPEDAPIADSLQLAFDQPESLLEHVAALRRHLLRSILVLLLCAAAAFAYLPQMLQFLTTPVGGLEQLNAIEVTEPIGVAMRVVLLAAFAVALPYIILELFLFIGPALSRRARLIGMLAIPLVVAFFFGGMAFAFYLVIPAGLPVLLNFLDVPTQIRPASYFRFTTGLMFWFGAVFEFPLLAYLLSAMRVLSAQVLIKNWRIAVVAIAILAAVITPTIDPINMMLVMLPLLILYAFSILLSFIAGGRREEGQGEEAAGE
jgi:sec-independent protein translocase protein TatC